MRNYLELLWRRCRLFARSESGLTLPVIAMAMVTLTAMTGLAIDVSRMQLIQSKLQFSLDAAGLAGGSTVSTSSLNSEVTKYLNANFNGYLGATVQGLTVTVNSSNTVISLSATATVPTTFLNIVGLTTITVNASSQITRAVTGLELILVLDNTGSMANSAGGSQSKIQALQTASIGLINTLYGNSTTAPANLYIGIVPFSQTVDIGTSYSSWMNTTYDNTITDWGPGGSWGGCVDARYAGNEDITDDPPVSGSTNTLFKQYYWTSDALNSDGVTNSNYNPWKQNDWKRCKGSSCSTVYGSCSTSGGYTCTALAPYYESPLNTTNQGPNLLCPQQVTPMTTNYNTLVNAINAMTPQGDTLINQGLQWGWFMISPRWRGLWGGSMNANNLPLNYGTKGMNKAIVLLTDGENTIDNTAHGGYWFVGDNHLGTTNSTTGVADLDARTTSLCTAMKAAGIYVYTIALGTDTTPSSLALLQNCATATNYYFNSPSTTQLQTVFSAIGDSLSNLRVSK